MSNVFLFSLALFNRKSISKSLNDSGYHYAADGSKRKTNSDSDWKNIRIKFDYSYIDGTKPDPKMCKTLNQKIEWYSINQCGASHLVTQEQINALKGTLENIRSFLQRFLKVIPLDSPIKVKNYRQYS